jgi:type IV pilus assembly protein PilE
LIRLALGQDNGGMTTPSLPLHCTRTANRRGFTLIELIIVVAIVAVLGAIAFPSFQGQIRKSRRADAVSTLSQIQQAQERFRANCPCYAHSITNATSTVCPAACPGTGSAAGLGIAAVAGARYTYALNTPSATAYTVTATAVPGSSQANDTGCTIITVAVAGGVATPTPPTCWSR